jgi:hypothetical protein
MLDDGYGEADDCRIKPALKVSYPFQLHGFSGNCGDPRAAREGAAISS